MSVRIATFNVENLMNRFDFTGYRNDLTKDRSLGLFNIKDEMQYREMETARVMAITDDTRQLTALAIADTRADILCLQEVDNLAALNAFEFGYLFRMVGDGYRQKYLIEGNDTRGIDVAIIMKEVTRDGQPIEFVGIRSHAALTFADLHLHNPALEALNIQANERIFRRDLLELDLLIGGRPLTLFTSHFKSKGGKRVGPDGASDTLPVRVAEAKAARHIIEEKFGKDGAAAATGFSAAISMISLRSSSSPKKVMKIISSPRCRSQRTPSAFSSKAASAKTSSVGARRTTAGPTTTQKARRSGS